MVQRGIAAGTVIGLLDFVGPWQRRTKEEQDEGVAELLGMGPYLIVVAFFVFCLAGLVKGLVGFGLPLIGLSLMTIFVGVEKAMLLILWPAFLTNVWQALSGGNLKPLLRRLWPFLTTAIVTMGLGTFILTKVQEGAADLLLGLLMVAYAVPMLLGLTLTLQEGRVTSVGIVAGLLNGVFSGLTGAFTVPGVMYLQALGLPRDAFIQAMGLLFLLSTIALGLSLGSFGLLGGPETIASLVLVVPALSGVWVGQRLRRRVSETAFRRLIQLAILSLGIYLVPLGIWRLVQ